MFDLLVTAAPRTGQIDPAVFRSDCAAIKTGADCNRDVYDCQQTRNCPAIILTLTAL